MIEEKPELVAAMERIKQRVAERRRRSLTVPEEWPPKTSTLRTWTVDGIDCAVTHSNGIFCGYAKVPAGHPDVGQFYDHVAVECHGGLTFCQLATDGGMWFGFDCAHHGDEGRWNEKRVATETERLAKQLADRGRAP